MPVRFRARRHVQQGSAAAAKTSGGVQLRRRANWTTRHRLNCAQRLIDDAIDRHGPDDGAAHGVDRMDLCRTARQSRPGGGTARRTFRTAARQPGAGPRTEQPVAGSDLAGHSQGGRCGRTDDAAAPIERARHHHRADPPAAGDLRSPLPGGAGGGEVLGSGRARGRAVWQRRSRRPGHSGEG